MINNNHTESRLQNSIAALVNFKTINKSHLMSPQYNHIPCGSVKCELKIVNNLINFVLYVIIKCSINKLI